MAGKLDLALTVRAVDQATAPLRKVGRAIQDVGRKTGLARAGAAAADLGRSLHGVGREAHRFARRAGLLALAAGASGIGLAGRFAAAGDSIAKTADKLGLGVVELQRYRYAAERAGVEQNTFDMAMQRFTRRVAEAAAGTGEAEAALRYLGIQLTDTNGDIRPAGAMLEEVADALARVEDPALRVRIAFKLFDSEGVSLVNMLSDGSAEMRRLGDEAERLDVLTDEQARSAEAYTDEVGKFRRALSFLGHVIGESLLPELTQLARRLTEFLVAARPGAAEEMRKALDSLAAAAAWLNTQWKRLAPVLGAWLERLQETFPPIRDWIAVAREWVDGAGLVTTAVIALAAALAHRLALAVLGLFRPLLRLGFALAGVGLRMTWMAGTAIIGMAKGLRGLLAPLRLAALAVFRLGIAFLATPIGWIVAGIAAVAGAAYLIYRNWEGIVGWFQRMWDGILAAFKVDELIAWLSGFSLTDTLAGWVDGVTDSFAAAWSGILAAFKVDKLIAWLSGFSLKDTLGAWVAGVVDRYVSVWNGILAAFKVDELIAWLSGFSLKDTLGAWVAGVVDWYVSAWSGILAAFKVDELIAWLSGFSLTDTLTGWIAGVVDWYVSVWSGILAAFKVDELIAWLSGFSLTDTLTGWIAGVVDWYVSVWSGILAAFKVDKLIAWLSGFNLTDTLTGWIDGVGDSFAATWADIRAAFKVDELIAWLSGFNLTDTLTGWFDGVADSFAAAWSGILSAFKVDELIAWLSGFSLTDTLTGWFDGVADAFAAAWADVRAAFGVDDLLAELREFDFPNMGIGWIEDLWSGVSDTWRQLADWIKNRLGIDDAADAQTAAPPQAMPALAPEPAPSFISPSSRALVGGEIRIVIDGLPRGSRIDSVRSDNPDVPLEVTSGYVMAGAG